MDKVKNPINGIERRYLHRLDNIVDVLGGIP